MDNDHNNWPSIRLLTIRTLLGGLFCKDCKKYEHCRGSGALTYSACEYFSYSDTYWKV